MAPKMEDYANAIAESSPNALVIVAASPINKLVPVLSELLQENGYYDCNRVMGSTASFNSRANCILASYVNTDPRAVFLPVIGGDSEDTIVPLFSQAKPHFNISEAVMKRLVDDIKQGSSLIYETKGCSEALNKAHATVKFLNSVMAGLRGEPNIMNIAFTKTTQVHGVEYFALPVLFGRFGIQGRYGIPRILPFENDLIKESVFTLQRDTEFAKLFCKSRETAAETCSRNVAIRYRKSKEFEKFVNGLKMSKNDEPEDKIANKIKPPIPIENGHLPGVEPFDPKTFCLRHKGDDQERNRLIPPYMRTEENVMPISLGYTFGNGKGMAQFVPKSSSAETPICEPVVCPDKPKKKEINLSNIVSLVESLVKKTAEKMMNEKGTDESLKRSLKNVEDVKASTEKDKNIKMSSDFNNKPENVNECLRKIDMLNVSSQKVANPKSNDKKTQKNTKKWEKKFTQSYYQTKNKSISIGRTDDKTNLHKKKYREQNLELIFSPTINTFKERYDYKSGIKKLNHPKEFQNVETKEKNITANNEKRAETKPQNIIMTNEKHPETTVANHERYNIVQRVSNFKSNNQSPLYRNRIVPGINNCTPGENKNCRNAVIHKNIVSQIQNKQKRKKEKTEFNLIVDNEKHIKSTAPKHDIHNNVKRVSYLKSDIQSSQQLNRIVPAGNKNCRNKIIDDILNQTENTKTLNKEKELRIKKDQNKSIFELDSCEPMFLNTSIDSQKKTSADDKNNIKNITSENVDKDHIQPLKDLKIGQYNKVDSLESRQNEKLVQHVNKMEDNKYLGDKYNTIFKKQNYISDKSYKENEPLNEIKELKYMKNILLGNLNSSMKNENMLYDNLNKKAYELLVERNSNRKTNRNIGNFNSLLSDNSFKDSKDFVKNKLRSKYLIKKSENNRLAKEEKDISSQTKDMRTDSNEVKSVCYNAFSNEVTQMNNADGRYDSGEFSASHNQFFGQNKNIEKKSIIPCTTNNIISTSEPKYEIKQNEILFQENQSTVQDSKDLNMLMKTLDSDVFKYDDIVNTNDEVKQVNITENVSDLSEEQKPKPDVTASNQNNSSEECNQSLNIENSQTTHITTYPDPAEMTFEDVIKELKLVTQSSSQQNESIDTGKTTENEKSIMNGLKMNTEIKNETKSQKDKSNKGSDAFPQIKEDILKNESPISNKYMTYESIAEKKGSVKNQIGLNNLKISEINNVVENISNSTNKSTTNFNKCTQGKSHTQSKVPCSTNNSDQINKVSSTIPERFLSSKTRDSKRNTKTNLHKGDSVGYIKSLRNGLKSKENNKQKKNYVKHEDLKVSNKNLNNFELSVKPMKHKNTRNENSITLNKPFTPFSKRSKSFISSKYNSLTDKEKTVSEMLSILSGNLGQKVDEINKAEHSFSLRDKNGINNYYLLKGLLPKIKNNKHNSDNQNGSLSFLKTNVCNEDPFMSIKDKQKNNINIATKKLVKPKLKKKKNYTSNDDGNSESLLITHNSVFSPNCSAPGFKHFLYPKDCQNKSSSPENKANKSRFNETILTNLSSMCNKVRSSNKKSSHQLNQKTHNFKLYSTSALPSKNKSPSCLCVEKKKTAKQVLITKNESTGAKLPKGFIKNQRITKILQKDFKKSSKYKNAEIQAKEMKAFKEKHGSNFCERNRTQKTGPLHSHIMSKTTKINEKFFSSGFDSSYIERYLKGPPKYIPHPKFSNSKDKQKYRKSPKDRRVADIFKINWSDSQNSNQQTKSNSMPVENDILVRGTCLDHVRNKFESDKAAKHELNSNASCNEQNTAVNSMESSSLSNVFVQYTKDFVKCEYPTNEKLPSIRQLHKCVFRSS
ncbi:putative leucine-rich repeat-containing protein DDB_G0290503 isoform X2 [Halyomorpha halys]|nr:uncharacterized protein PFB0145c isoform X2 [Halyomorpha halys]